MRSTAPRIEVVAGREPVPGDVGAECVPAGVPALRQLCRSAICVRKSASRKWVRGNENRRCATCDRARVRYVAVRACAGCGVTAAYGADRNQRAQKSPGAGPIVVLETAKGVIEFETYPEEAPKTVARIVELAKKGFYNGHRFHRAEPNFLIQVGDPQSRNVTMQEWWGRGAGTGKPIGVAGDHQEAAPRARRGRDGVSRQRSPRRATASSTSS